MITNAELLRMVRNDLTRAKGKLIAGGCPSEDVAPLARNHVRSMWTQLADEARPFHRDRILAALRKELYNV